MAYEKHKRRPPQEDDGTLIEGRNAVLETLRAGRAVDKIFLAEGAHLADVAAEAKKRGIPTVTCDRRKLDHMSVTGTHQGVIAQVAAYEYSTVEDILNKAKKLVKIDYEELEPVRGIAEAKREDAPKVHSKGNLCQTRHVVRGDAAKALAESKYTVTNSFRTPFTEHAFLEPECAVAFPYKDGVKILSTDQGAYDTRKETAIMFGWDPERVVVENQLIGGGFGGKEDVSVQHIAALAAWKYQVPVKAKFSRQESLYFHPKRHAMEGTFTLGCDENGIFTGLDCEINFDTGAYASLCGPVL